MGLELCDHFQAVQFGHGDIDDRHVRQVLVGFPDRLPAVGSFRHHFHVAAFFDNPAKPGANNTVIVCQQYAYHAFSFEYDAEGYYKIKAIGIN